MILWRVANRPIYHKTLQFQAINAIGQTNLYPTDSAQGKSNFSSVFWCGAKSLSLIVLSNKYANFLGWSKFQRLDSCSPSIFSQQPTIFLTILCRMSKQTSYWVIQYLPLLPFWFSFKSLKFRTFTRKISC